MAVGGDRLEAVTVTRRIAYEGSGPFVRALVEALEDQGVTVVVRRNGPPGGRHRQSLDMGDDVNATLVVTGPAEAIDAGVGMFRRRFAKFAEIRVEGEVPPPPTEGGTRPEPDRPRPHHRRRGAAGTTEPSAGGRRL